MLFCANLFFAYVDNIAKDITYDFARKIFLDPIYEIIKNIKKPIVNIIYKLNYKNNEY